MGRGRCHLFLGPEIGEKQDTITEIRRSLIRRGSGAPPEEILPEETSFYPGETPVTDIVAILRNGSLFADVRFFLIKNAETIKKKEEVDLLVSYMESPQEDTILILVSEATMLDRRLEKAVPPGKKRIFWELFEDRKADWVATFFRREGYRITARGIETILELVENNTDALRRECSRLMLFLGKDEPADAEDVEKWLSHTREESAFTLFSRIAVGDLPKSIEILHALLAAKESPQAIFAGLIWCFRKLRDYMAATASGRLDDGEYRRMGLSSPKTRREYATAARRYASADDCLALISEFEFLIRSPGSIPGVLLDLLLYKLITGPEKGREKWFYY